MRRKLMDASSGSAAPVLRHFCSQAHCEEGKEAHEVTMKEYNCELARKEREVNRKIAEQNTCVDNIEVQIDEWIQKVTELEENQERERENHELKLNELQTDMYKSKRPSKELGEVMKRETANLHRIFRKKELEVMKEIAALKFRQCRGIISIKVIHCSIFEELEAFYREKYAGDNTTFQEKMVQIRKVKETAQETFLQTRESTRICEEQQIGISKELDAINAELDSKDNDTATSTTSAAASAAPGPVKTATTAQQPEGLKATSSFEGEKKVQSGEIHPSTATTATSVGATEATLKQGGVSLDLDNSKDETVLCSHPGCSQLGTKSCGLCRTEAYCSAKCQTDDWPRHKESCEGNLHKLGMEYCQKAHSFYDQHNNWAQSLRYCNLALTKLDRMKKRPVKDIFEIRETKCQALTNLCRDTEALEYARETYHLSITEFGPAHSSMITPAFSLLECLRNSNTLQDLREAELLARTIWETLNSSSYEDKDSFLRAWRLAEGSRCLAQAIFELALKGGIPPEKKQKAGEEAIVLARRASEYRQEGEVPEVAYNMDLLADILSYFNGNYNKEEITRLREQSKVILSRK